MTNKSKFTFTQKEDDPSILLCFWKHGKTEGYFGELVKYNSGWVFRPDRYCDFTEIALQAIYQKLSSLTKEKLNGG